MGRIISVFLLILGIFLVLGWTKREKLTIVSPISGVFGVSQPKVINEWFPQGVSSDSPSNFYLSAKSALLVNYDTGQIIFAKNAKSRLPVASTIKIMTALIALEKASLTDLFVVSEKASKVGENSMGLKVSEKLTLEELLYGLMLVSGNDAAVTIAEGIAGSEEQYVALMNKKLGELGLNDSKFVNATGLDVDPDLIGVDGASGYSTAYDLATIARYTWENYPVFRKIAQTEHKYIEANNNHGDFDLYNDTNLLTTYPGVKGIKPGFTWEAGLCLVTYAENERERLVGVILGSDDRRGEMAKLLDYGFGQLGIHIDHPALDL